MKSRSTLMMMAAMAMMSGGIGSFGTGGELRPPQFTDDEKESRVNEHRGLTQFHFGGGSLWALNEKSARKKAKKKGWLV